MLSGDASRVVVRLLPERHTGEPAHVTSVGREESAAPAESCSIKGAHVVLGAKPVLAADLCVPDV